MDHGLTGGAMTRSIFDPTGGEMEQKRGTFMPGAAENISHLPPDIVEGKVEVEPEAKVPLKGEAGEDTLSQTETEELTEAAEAARAEENNPDSPADPSSPRKSGQEAAEEGSAWIEDI